MSQECPMCGHRHIEGAIMRHLDDAEMRIDRGKASEEEFTTSYIVKRLDLNPGNCYRVVRGLVMNGMLEELPKRRIKPHMVVPVYRLSDAGRAFCRELRAFDRAREHIDRLRGTQ
jgi:DNA-binding IclR family transcriptional regulator